MGSKYSSAWAAVVRHIAIICLIVSPSALWAQSPSTPNSADPEVRDASRFDPKRPLSQELRTSIADGFTMVAVGDCIISRPMSQYAAREPGFAATVKVLQQADATYGNMETSILDLRSFQGYPYTGPDDVTLVAEPAVAKDLAAMGFDVMSRANNHALDWGVAGMRETSRHLDEAGLIYAGAGENRGLARAPHYFESSKGRVAIVSVASTFPPWAESLAPQGAAPGRPGISPLKVKKVMVLPPEGMAQLAALSRTLYPPSESNKSQDSKWLGEDIAASRQALYFRRQI